jgi:hypothetical protein
MRWKVKSPPKEGDWRRRIKFAWFPTQVEDHVVWLETFAIKEHFIAVAMVDEGIVHPEMQWVEYDRNLLFDY